MRVHQWVKNIFVFLPVFFSGKILEEKYLFQSCIAFFVFSFASSAVYVVNDIFDIEKDKLHPTKKNRPLATGKVSISSAYFVAAICFIASVTLGFYFLNEKAMLILGAYLLMNVLYSMRLKNIAILDISIIATGFVLRVLFGGYATGLSVSKWAVLLTYTLALVLAIGKRRGELVGLSNHNNTRKVLVSYNIQMLDTSLSIVAGVTIMCYIMYTLSPQAEAVFKNGFNYLYFSTILVIMGVLRYIQQTMLFNQTESPTKFLYKDKFLQMILLAWIGVFFVVLYIK